MTQNAALKKIVRARMAETGEKYTVALRAVMAERGQPDPGRADAPADTPDEDDAA